MAYQFSGEVLLCVDFAVLRKHGPKLIVTAGLAWLALFIVVLVLCLIWK
jgi:hypothetical protein